MCDIKVHEKRSKFQNIYISNNDAILMSFVTNVHADQSLEILHNLQ